MDLIFAFLFFFAMIMFFGGGIAWAVMLISIGSVWGWVILAAVASGVLTIAYAASM